MTWLEVIRHNGWQWLIHLDQGIGIILPQFVED